MREISQNARRNIAGVPRLRRASRKSRLVFRCVILPIAVQPFRDDRRQIAQRWPLRQPVCVENEILHSYCSYIETLLGTLIVTFVDKSRLIVNARYFQMRMRQWRMDCCRSLRNDNSIALFLLKLIRYKVMFTYKYKQMVRLIEI